MKVKISHMLFASSALALTLPTVAYAEATPADAAEAEAEAEATGDEGIIIVKARRGEENLQDVPVSVQVVGAEELQNLSITSVEEISKLAPGLTLVNAGASTNVTLRGITWQPGSGTPATPIYFNEIGFDPGQTITSMFDIGQIEVLRGPQGTTRGAPSISGAVTMTTQKPDLQEIGGYVQGQYGNKDFVNVQAALNFPIIKDVLAIRIAGNFENSDGNRIYSVNSNIKPSIKDRSYRASILFKPTDTLTIDAMYQRRETDIRVYTQVAGPGSPGAPPRLGGLFAAVPANFNGPALSTSDNASVQDAPTYRQQHVDLFTFNANWEVANHTITFNHGNQINRGGQERISNDPLNILPGFEAYNLLNNIGTPEFSINEIHISSLPADNRPFDYDLGWYSKKSGGDGVLFQSPVFALPGTMGGAFGAPFTPPGAITSPNMAYVLNSLTTIKIDQDFQSFYGNVRFHITDRTELSGGLAIVSDRVSVDLDIETSAARAIVTPSSVVGGFCQLIPGGVASTYPGFCDVVIPAGPRPGQSNDDNYNKALYNFSLSHKFTDDLMVYATTGTSFRTGLPAINNPGLPNGLTTPKPESATSYEIGFKSKFGAVTVNGAVFQLSYKDQLTTFEGVPYFNSVSGATAQTSLAFFSNIDAKVRGFELEVAARPSDNLSFGVNLSYSKIESEGGNIPCRDATRPITAANPINLCASPKGQTLNQQAPFQATVNGSYELPLSDSMNGYVRFNVNYNGKNPNFGNFPTTSGFTKTPAYAVVDLFAGVNGGDGAWNIGLYGKNVFDKQAELGRVATINSIYPLYQANPGYDVVRSSRPREFGVTARFAFGSR